MDYIMIDRLTVFANHGVYEEENKLGQKFEISAKLYLDTEKAGYSDELTDSVNYGEVCREIARYMEENTFHLIEACAQGLADWLLMRFSKLYGVMIRVHKPWAPIKMPVETVGISIERFWHTAYIALGSNLGQSKDILDGAVAMIEQLYGSHVEKVSEYLCTKPYGKTDQPEFLNACLVMKTLLSPRELLNSLHQIENHFGRTREEHWGPRTLDLDIIFYDDAVIEDDDLCIPHVDMHNRQFVLEPLAQIAPYKRHPLYKKTVTEMLHALDV